MEWPKQDLLSVILKPDFSLSVNVSWVVIGLLLFLVVVVFLTRFAFGGWPWRRGYQIDEVALGVGKNNIKIKPNDMDRQIAYKIWVELSTRKIGLPIDLNDDVVVEIYNSWYNFFSVTRELIKDVPVSKFKRKDTEGIIRLSINVLNEGIRPHLTKWQARFRRWYESALDSPGYKESTPQDIQREYFDFPLLEKDILKVNEKLIEYRKKMYQIVKGE